MTYADSRLGNYSAFDYCVHLDNENKLKEIKQWFILKAQE